MGQGLHFIEDATNAIGLDLASALSLSFALPFGASLRFGRAIFSGKRIDLPAMNSRRRVKIMRRGILHFKTRTLCWDIDRPYEGKGLSDIIGTVSCA